MLCESSCCTGTYVSILRHVDVNAYDVLGTTGGTVLYMAATISDPCSNRCNVIRVLLLPEAGADTELQPASLSGTPLHAAAGRRISSRGTMCALLEGGANVNKRNAFLQTSLYCACSVANTGAVECGASAALGGRREARGQK